MSTLSEQISRTQLANRVFSERQLQDHLGASGARRYGLVNRALKDGSLLRLKRGLYMLGDEHRREVIHPFAAAQALVPGSYVSLETALAFHGWIPEAVFTTSSVSPGRKTLQYTVPRLGLFTFHPLAIHDYQFLVAIEYRKLGARTAFVASPLRALMDLVALRRQVWSGLGWVTDGLRIAPSTLLVLRRKDFEVLKPVYKHKAVNVFLHELEQSVVAMKSEMKEVRNDD